MKKSLGMGLDNKGARLTQPSAMRPAAVQRSRAAKRSGHQPPSDESVALVLQGGGALGAYQAGVYEALAVAGYRPDWVAGISIGAVNAAIIAGNPIERRVERLHAFWDLVSSRVTGTPFWSEGWGRSWFNEASASVFAVTGAPGFRAAFSTFISGGTSSLEAISYYDTEPLRKTLLELVDFDCLNAKGAPRVSVGAVNVLSGNFKYFDTHDGCVIGPEHIMASGALPPGFAPVIIDGEPYWDGGLVSNTPLQHVLDNRRHDQNACVFQVDLFSARGLLPQNMLDVAQREKDIRFSSRTRFNTDVEKELQILRMAAERLTQKLPAALRNDPDVELLVAKGRSGEVTIMHLINRPEAFETQSKDYEFSRATITGHWADGVRDVEKSLSDKRWINRKPSETGIAIFDLTQDSS